MDPRAEGLGLERRMVMWVPLQVSFTKAKMYLISSMSTVGTLKCYSYCFFPGNFQMQNRSNKRLSCSLRSADLVTSGKQQSVKVSGQ